MVAVPLEAGSPMTTVLDEWRFPRRADNVAAARHYVHELARKVCGYGERTDTTELAAGELLANAARHGAGDHVHVSVSTYQVLRVEVHDGGTARIGAASGDPLSETGRGLFIVEAFTDASGIDQDEGGTTAWFEVHIPQGEACGQPERGDTPP